MSAPTSAGAVVVLGRPSSWRWIVTPAAGTESFAIVVAAAAFILCLPIAAIVFWGRELQISGHASLGQFVAIAGGVSAAAAFLISRSLSTRYRRGGAARRERFLWFDLTALAVGYAAIALLGWLGAATVMEHSFTGATVFSVPAMLLASAAVAVSAYIAYISGSDLSASGLSLVLALFLVVGMVTAMLSAQNPQWWQMNLSALGMTHDISSLTFNLTLIVSGIMVTTIARIGTAAIPTRSESEARRRTAVRVLFVLLGVLLACVGVFPVDRFFLLHNTVATGMTVAFAALVFGLPWLVPTMPKSFVVLGFVFVAVMVVLVVFFFTGVYNLTAVELIAAVMIFAWIILGSLGFAPLIVVQPVGVTALVFTVVLTALIAKRRPSAAVIRAIATCVLGVAAFVTVAALVSTQTAITDQQLIAVLVVLGSVLLVTAIVMVVGRRRTTPPVMWVLLGGIYSAFVATLGKTVILRVQTAWKHHDLTLDDKNLLTIGCLIGIGVAGGLSIYFVQRAHAFNKPEVVVAGLTVIDPAIAVVLGITILGEANNAPALSIVAFIVAGAVAVTGVFQLSRAEQAEPALD